MVNVAALAMAQARALNLEGPLLREFGFAALMHDIGKVNTPLECSTSRARLTDNEFRLMKQHVIDGAHILRRTPEMPALARSSLSAHLKQDLSGYPENIGHRKLNLCTMIVSIADVFDALRSNRPYREGLATARIRSIMSEQGNPAFNQVLLRRFVNLMGCSRSARLSASTLRKWAWSPRSIRKIRSGPGEDLYDPRGEQLERAHPREPGNATHVESFSRCGRRSVDPDSVEIDPLSVL